LTPFAKVTSGFSRFWLTFGGVTDAREETVTKMDFLKLTTEIRVSQKEFDLPSSIVPVALIPLVYLSDTAKTPSHAYRSQGHIGDGDILLIPLSARTEN
jgi:hypothetical protein